MKENKLMKKEINTEPVIVIVQQMKTGDIKLTDPKGGEYILNTKNSHKVIQDILNDPDMPQYNINAIGSGDPIKDMLNQGLKEATPFILQALRDKLIKR